MLLCCVLAINLFGAQQPKAPEHDGMTLRASTTMGRLHVELRKDANGPLHVKLGYGDASGGEYADAISLTLGSAREEV